MQSKIFLEIKKHPKIFSAGILSIAIDTYLKHIFYTAFFTYFVLISYLISDLPSKQIRKNLSILFWTSFLLLFFVGFYVNNYLPHGRSYPTGDVICENDGRGPCGEQYKEDLRYVHIPEWAKFLRTSEGELIMFGLLVAGIAASTKKVDE